MSNTRNQPKPANKTNHLYLPEEYRNPDELFLGISHFDSSNYLGFKLPINLDTNFILAKHIKDIKNVSNDSYMIKFLSIIPSKIIKQIYNIMPKDINRVPSIFSLAFTMNILTKHQPYQDNQLYGLIFLNKRKSYSTLWVTSPVKEIIPLLSKCLYLRYGKLIGFFSSRDIEKYNQQAKQILFGEMDVNLDALVYDFREMDKNKAKFHSFSREYPHLSPKEATKAVMKNSQNLVNQIKEYKGINVETELNRDEEYKELLAGITWARNEELKFCKKN